MARIEWRGNELLARLDKKADVQLKAAAKAAFRMSKLKVPTGKRDYVYRGSAGQFQSWRHRTAGSLAKSLRWRKSRYPGGGYIVQAGSYDVFYARFVEYGIPKPIGGRYRTGPKKGSRIPTIRGKHFLEQGLDVGKRVLRRRFRKLI